MAARRQSPTSAKQARELLAERYSKDADLADAMAANASTSSVASDLKRVATRKRKYAGTAKRLSGY